MSKSSISVGKGSLHFDVEIENNCPEIQKAFENALNRALDAIGEAAVENAQARLEATVYSQTGLPYELTGNLRESIKKQPSYEEKQAVIGSNLPYALGIETGTHRKKGAVHYLQDAVSAHNDQYEKITIESLENA